MYVDYMYVILSPRCLSRSAVSIKESIVRGREAELCVLSERVFCGWEFSICSDKTARLRHKMLYKDFLVRTHSFHVRMNYPYVLISQ